MPRKNKTVIQIKILVLWERERKRQAVISVTLGTFEIASPKAVLFQLSSITKSRLGTGLQYLLESFASVPEGHFAKASTRGSCDCFSNLVTPDIVGEPGISVWCFFWVSCRHVHWPVLYFLLFFHFSVLSHSVCSWWERTLVLTAFHSCGGCCLLTAITSSQHPSCADALSLEAQGKTKDTVENPFDFPPKCHLGNEWLGFFIFHLTADLGKGL